MLQQEVDRLIDFVINNNIKTKTIKDLGKARFKKTSLPEVPSTREWVASNEKKQKDAAAAVKKATDRENRLKKLKEMSAKEAAAKGYDDTQWYDPQEMMDPALLDRINSVTQNYDPLDEFHDPIQITDPELLDRFNRVAQNYVPTDEFYEPDELAEDVFHDLDEEPTKKPTKKKTNKDKDKTLKTKQSRVRGLQHFITEEDNEERKDILSKFAALISKWTHNPAVTEDMVKNIVSYYQLESNKKFLDVNPANSENACGVLAFLFNCSDLKQEEIGHLSFSYKASFLTKQQIDPYKAVNLKHFSFVLAGEEGNQLMFAIKTKNGKFKQFTEALTARGKGITGSENKTWKGNFYRPESLNNDAKEILRDKSFKDASKTRFREVPFILNAVRADEVEEDMIDYDNEIEDQQVPRLRSPLVIDSGEPGEELVGEPIIEEVGAGQRGGWIWLLA